MYFRCIMAGVRDWFGAGKVRRSEKGVGIVEPLRRVWFSENGVFFPVTTDV